MKDSELQRYDIAITLIYNINFRNYDSTHSINREPGYAPRY